MVSTRASALSDAMGERRQTRSMAVIPPTTLVAKSTTDKRRQTRQTAVPSKKTPAIKVVKKAPAVKATKKATANKVNKKATAVQSPSPPRRKSARLAGMTALNQQRQLSPAVDEGSNHANTPGTARDMPAVDTQEVEDEVVAASPADDPHEQHVRAVSPSVIGSEPDEDLIGRVSHSPPALDNADHGTHGLELDDQDDPDEDLVDRTVPFHPVHAGLSPLARISSTRTRLGPATLLPWAELTTSQRMGILRLSEAVHSGIVADLEEYMAPPPSHRAWFGRLVADQGTIIRAHRYYQRMVAHGQGFGRHRRERLVTVAGRRTQQTIRRQHGAPTGTSGRAELFYALA